MEREDRLLSRTIVFLVIFTAFYFSIGIKKAFPTGIEIPQHRHIIFSPSWFKKLFYNYDTFSLELSVIGSQKEGTATATTTAQIVSFTEEGELIESGEFLEVEPETTRFYPNELKTIKVKWKKPQVDKSIIVALMVTTKPETTQEEGLNFTIESSTGFLFMLSSAYNTTYKVEPFFTTEGEKLCIENPSSFGMQAYLQFLKNGEKANEIPSFFLQAKSKRYFDVPSDTDSVIMDVEHISKRLGYRLGKSISYHQP